MNFKFNQIQQFKNKKNIIILSLLGVTIVLFAALQIVTQLINENVEEETTFITIQNINADGSLSTQQLGDDFYKAASGGAPISQPAPAAPKQPNTKTQATETPPIKTATKPAEPKDELVTVNISANVGRAHPFVPAVKMSAFNQLQKLQEDSYPAPPTQIIQNETAIKLMETTISGIMYDALSPSAIISVEGQDHVVRKGDRINGYRIVNITKDRVVVQNGTNVYRATVGETLTTENNSVNFNEVYNLQHKFGGKTAPKGTRMIQIN